MSRARAALLALMLALPATQPAGASGWGGFYGSAGNTAPRALAPPAPTEGAPTEGAPLHGDMGRCLREILAAQIRHQIPNNLLLAIGLQEAGVRRGGSFTVWPWAVNAAGVGRVFDSREDALAWIASERARGVNSIDVGCMQINMRWHPDAFTDARQGFDPAVNVDYSARFLKRLYRQTGSWTAAAGAYHSQTPEHQQRYLAALKRNLTHANDRIGELRELAATGVPGPSEDAAPPMTLAWSAGLSQGGRHGIYSRREIGPVLPAMIPSRADGTPIR